MLLRRREVRFARTQANDIAAAGLKAGRQGGDGEGGGGLNRLNACGEFQLLSLVAGAARFSRVIQFNVV